MIKLIPLIIVAFLVYLAYTHFRKLPSKEKKPFVIKWLVYITIGLLLLAFATGRISWLGAVAAGVLGLIKFGASTFIRFLPFLRFLQSKQVFGNPVFKTTFLEMQVDFKTGIFSGRVLDGEFKDRTLDTLADQELDSLETYLRDRDKRGYYLLRVFRQRGQQTTNKTVYEPVDDPTIEEARLILGLAKDFDKKDIDKAYKRLMQKLHPDRGGNDYLASRVNRARDLLISHLDNT